MERSPHAPAGPRLRAVHPQAHPGSLLYFFVLSMLGLGIASCSGQTTGLPNFPTLVFDGRVVTSDGSGLQSRVVLTQRWPGTQGPCSPDNSAFERVADTDPEGHFELEHSPNLGIEGCFVLRVFTPPDPLPLDSLVLTFDDIEPFQDADAPTVIRVPVEIVVHPTE